MFYTDAIEKAFAKQNAQEQDNLDFLDKEVNYLKKLYVKIMHEKKEKIK